MSDLMALNGAHFAFTVEMIFVTDESVIGT